MHKLAKGVYVKFQVNGNMPNAFSCASYPVSTLKFSAIFLPRSPPESTNYQPPAKEFNFERYTIFRIC